MDAKDCLQRHTLRVAVKKLFLVFTAITSTINFSIHILLATIIYLWCIHFELLSNKVKLEANELFYCAFFTGLHLQLKVYVYFDKNFDLIA